VKVISTGSTPFSSVGVNVWSLVTGFPSASSTVFPVLPSLTVAVSTQDSLGLTFVYVT